MIHYCLKCEITKGFLFTCKWEADSANCLTVVGWQYRKGFSGQLTMVLKSNDCSKLQTVKENRYDDRYNWLPVDWKPTISTLLQKVFGKTCGESLITFSVVKKIVMPSRHDIEDDMTRSIERHVSTILEEGSAFTFDLAINVHVNPLRYLLKAENHRPNWNWVSLELSFLETFNNRASKVGYYTTTT